MNLVTPQSLTNQEEQCPHNAPKTSLPKKYSIVMEAETVAEDQLGAFSRRNGIHEAQLYEWRGMMLLGLQKPVKPSSKPSRKLGGFTNWKKNYCAKTKHWPRLPRAQLLLVLAQQGFAVVKS
jgi:transposase